MGVSWNDEIVNVRAEAKLRKETVCNSISMKRLKVRDGHNARSFASLLCLSSFALRVSVT
jgi:hypothetical protein